MRRRTAGRARMPAVALVLILLSLLAPAGARAGVVAGQIRYTDRILTDSGFSGTKLLPVRFADVSVLSSTQTVLATGATDANGNYTLNVTPSGSVTAFVRVDAAASSTVQRIAVQVLSDQTNKVLLTAATPQATLDTTQNVTINFDIPVTSGSTGVSGAFNILDKGITAQQFIDGFSSRMPPLLTFFWQPIPDGQGSDQGTFYDSSQNAIFLLDRNTPDTLQPQAPNHDEFDDAVMLHETGHYILHNYSFDHSLGGEHFIDVPHEDLRLAWSEGWATFWSCMVRKNPELINSLGDTQVFSFEIETPSFAAFTTGEDTEQSVSAVLWDIFDDNEPLPTGVTGPDPDPLQITDGKSRIMAVILDDYLDQDDCILEDFINKWHAHWGSFQSVPLDQVCQARDTFVVRPHLYTFAQKTTIPAPGSFTASISVGASLTLTNVNTFVAMEHRNPPDVVLTLTSPAGTVLSLANKAPTSATDGFFEWYSPFETPVAIGSTQTAFLGQSSKGTWKLTVQDTGSGQQGVLTKWRLDLGGTLSAPDIFMRGVTCPDVLSAGQIFPVTATVVNLGPSDITSPFTVRFVVSQTKAVSTTNPSMGDFTVSSLAAGQSFDLATRIVLPSNTPTGQSFVGAIADPAGAITEGDKDNNVSREPVLVSVTRAPSDLAAVSITGPTTGAVGRTISITAKLENLGGDPVTVPFFTDISLRHAAGGQPDIRLTRVTIQPSIAGLQSVTISTSPVIPATAPADVYALLLSVDPTQVATDVSRSNNVTVSAANVTVVNPNGPADLIVASVLTPSTGFQGFSVPVTVTVENVGGKTAAGPFTTALFLTPTAQITSTTPRVGSFDLQALASGQSATVTTQALIPSATPLGLYLVGADADVTARVTESTKANNEAFSTPPIQIFQPLPDLAVTSVVAPASALLGGTLPVTFSVANQGIVTAQPSFQTQVILSRDSVIDAADTVLANVTTASLDAGRSFTLNVSTTVSSTLAAGLYQLAVRTNATTTVVETTLSNDLLLLPGGIVLTHLTAGPDIFAQSLVAPASVDVGGNLPLTATIANIGSVDANVVFDNRFFLSTTSNITVTDLLLGDVQTGGLAAGTSLTFTHNFPVPVGLAPGTYFVGFIADVNNATSDVDRSNNTTAAATTLQVQVLLLPDLVPTEVLAPTTTTTGAVITVTQGIENAGTAIAPAGSVTRWFLSSVPTVTTTATPLGDFIEGGIEPGSTEVLSRQLTIPTTVVPGNYFLGFIANVTDAITESNLTNNASAAVPIRIARTSRGADLAIPATPIVTPTVYAAGSFGVLTAQVVNEGDVLAPGPFSMGVFLSTTSTITANQRSLGAASVPALRPGQTSPPVQKVFQIPQSTSPGTYFVGAIADVSHLVNDVNRANNASDGVPVTVTPQSPLADIEALTVSGPGVATLGQAVTVKGIIANGGGQSTGPFHTTFLLESGGVIKGKLGDVLVSNLSALVSQQLSVTGTLAATLPPDAYFLVMSADSRDQVLESDKTNNIVLSVQTMTVTLTSTPPDLVATSATVPTSAVVGTTIPLAGIIKNIGIGSTQVAFPSAVRLTLTTSTPITTFVAQLDSFTLPAMGPGNRSVFSRSETIPSTIVPGKYFVAVSANSPETVAESTLTNNDDFVPILIKGGPNLTVTSVAFTPGATLPGRTITVTASVENTGTVTLTPPPGTLVNRYFLSRNATASTTDFLLGISTIDVSAGLVPLQSVTFTHALTIPVDTTPGTGYRVYVLTDATNSFVETRKDDNVGFAPGALALGVAPSLKNVGVTGPATARGGRAMTFTVSVENTGAMAVTTALEVNVALVPTPSGSVQAVGITTLATSTYMPGKTLTLAGRIVPPVTIPSGLYDVQVTLDPDNKVAEIDESAAAHVRAATVPTAFTQPSGTPPGVTLTYSVPPGVPVAAGPLTITAVFTAPVTVPTIEIDTPGPHRLPPTPMQGGGQVWTLVYDVPAANGVTDVDGVDLVQITGAFDASGNENLPPSTNATFTVDTTPPLITVTSNASGDVVVPPVTLSGTVADASSLIGSAEITGGSALPLVLPLTIAPITGAFSVTIAPNQIPSDIFSVTFQASDAAGNRASAVALSLARDTDGDGLPDWYERIASGGASATSVDPNAQPPGFFGLTELQIFQDGINRAMAPTSDPTALLPSVSVPAPQVLAPQLVALVPTVTNPAGGSVTFAWRQTAGTPVALSSATAARPTVLLRAVDTYLFQVQVTNSVGHSTTAVEQITITNEPPVASAGLGGVVALGTTVLVDGSRSSDPNDDALTYTWRVKDLTGVSEGDKLSAGPSPFTTFTPVVPGFIDAELTVSDGTSASPVTTAHFLAADPATLRVPPSASAGVRQVVATKPGLFVTLDGTASRAPDPRIALVYTWTQTAGAAVTLSNAASATPSIANPSVGVRTFQLVTSYSMLDPLGTGQTITLQSLPATVDVVVTAAVGLAPSAIVGPSQTRFAGEVVTLDGSASVAASGGSLTYAWTQSSGAGVTLATPTAARPTFSPVVGGDYLFGLVVDDAGVLSDPAVSTVHVLESATDALPLAVARLLGFSSGLPEYRVTVPPSGQLVVTLDATGSSDPLSRPLTFRWQQIGGPPCVLSSLESPTPTFTPTVVGDHQFQLTARAGRASSQATIDVLVDSLVAQVPRASASAPSTAHRGSSVTLTGGGSTPQGTVLMAATVPGSFQWVQTGGPLVSLSSATVASPTFVPPVDGIYTFSLFVSSGGVRSQASSVSINVVEPQSSGGGGGGGSTVNGAPASAAGGGGGGCAAGPRGDANPWPAAALLILVGVAVLRRRRRAAD